MRLEKKTMSTLLMMILIIMMGVIPAFSATNDSIGLLVTVDAYTGLSIVVTGADMDFGSMYPHETSGAKSFTVSVGGTDAASITSTLTSGDHTNSGSFWMTYLHLTYGSSIAYTIGGASLSHAADGSEVYSFSATLGPLTGATPSTTPYSDTIVFWIS